MNTTVNIDIILPIKRQWFNMIKNNIKLEEYREIKPYYSSRFKNIAIKKHCPEKFNIKVMFRNGYHKESPYIIANCNLKIKEGNPDWGAKPNTKYYTLIIEHIIEIKE